MLHTNAKETWSNYTFVWIDRSCLVDGTSELIPSTRKWLSKLLWWISLPIITFGVLKSKHWAEAAPTNTSQLICDAICLVPVVHSHLFFVSTYVLCMMPHFQIFLFRTHVPTKYLEYSLNILRLCEFYRDFYNMFVGCSSMQIGFLFPDRGIVTRTSEHSPISFTHFLLEKCKTSIVHFY